MQCELLKMCCCGVVDLEVQVKRNEPSLETVRAAVTNLHLTLAGPVLFENARSIGKS